MMQITLTPEKNIQVGSENVNKKKTLKKTGQKIPQNEPAAETIQDKLQQRCVKMSLKKTLIILFIIFIPIMIFILTYSIASFTKEASANEVIVMYKEPMMTELKTGEQFQSEAVSLKTSPYESIDLGVNSVQEKKRLLQAGFIGKASKILSYYHKNTQISISIDNALRIQIQIPGDTGLDFVIGDFNNECLKELQKLPVQLPLVFKEVLGKLTKKNVEVTSCAAYDGVYNKNTKDYTLLNEKKFYHPEIIAKIQPKEKDLIGAQPKVKNCSSIAQITAKIASLPQTLITNFKKLISENKGMFLDFIDNSNKKSADKTVNPSENVKRCVRIGKQVLRCCADTWKQFKVTNEKEAKPIEVWQIIINIQ